MPALLTGGHGHVKHYVSNTYNACHLGPAHMLAVFYCFAITAWQDRLQIWQAPSVRVVAHPCMSSICKAMSHSKASKPRSVDIVFH